MTKEAQTLSVEKELETYKEQKANIMGPSINMEGLSEFHRVVVDTERLSANPEDGDIYKHKDAYKGKPAQYIITGRGNQKLALCAGVVWDPRETRATALSQKYVAYNAVGCIRKPDGTPECLQAEADVDIDVVEDELREKFKKKRKDWGSKDWFQKMSKESQDDYIESAFKKELNYKKTHKTKTAATNARSRVIKPLLRLKKTYTLEELGRPFVIARVVLQPDYSDPEVKRLMLKAAIQAQLGVFGAASIPAIEQSATVEMSSDDYTIQPVPEDDDDDSDQASPLAADDQVEYPDRPLATDDNKEPSKQEVFEDLSAIEQIKTLKQLCDLKGYEPKQPVGKLGPGDRLGFWLALDKLPNIEPTPDDDIPF